jgi:transcriptional regulator GlxA family with amidase domain
MKLGIPIYEGVNLLDVAGPLEMFYWAGQSNDLQTVLVSADGRAVTSINKVRFEPHASFAQTPALDVLWVPGGDLLDGHAATTHWAFVECLQCFPAIKVDTTHQRFVVSGNRLTGGGISSGLDEALKLISLSIPSTPSCTMKWD